MILFSTMVMNLVETKLDDIERDEEKRNRTHDLHLAHGFLGLDFLGSGGSTRLGSALKNQV